MQHIDVFEFDSYIQFLLAQEKGRPRGFRALLARTIECRASYVSQVFSGEADFSLEQAEKVSELLGLDEAESNYFFLLVLYARAATDSLKRRLKSQLAQRRDDRKRLKYRLDIPTLEPGAQAVYYSSWKYAAVHVAVSMPALDSPEKIARRLGIPVAQVASIIRFLLKAELLRQDGKRIVLGKARVHLEDDSPFIVQHHCNWRYKAVESLNAADSGDYASRLHYSSIVTLSAEDATAIREMLQKGIEAAKAKIAKSPEEVLYGLNLDFYPVKG